MNSQEALNRLIEGNKRYLDAKTNDGDISLSLRKDTFENGQHPYAAVLTCSDSRVVPEDIFMTGIGEIFTIRVAGNTMGDSQLASAVYGLDHLGCKVFVVLGHTHCGAIDATINHGGHGCLHHLTDPIEEAIGDETDDRTACELNVRASVKKFLASEEGAKLIAGDVKVVGAIYDIETGKVDFLD